MSGGLLRRERVRLLPQGYFLAMSHTCLSKSMQPSGLNVTPSDSSLARCTPSPKTWAGDSAPDAPRLRARDPGLRINLHALPDLRFCAGQQALDVRYVPQDDKQRDG